MATKFFAALFAAVAISVSASAKTVNNATAEKQNSISAFYSTGADGHDYKNVYITDEEGRVTSKVLYVMNADGMWSPMGAYSVFYGDSTNTLTYAAYDSKTHTFTKHAQQTAFDAAEYPVVITMPK